MGGFSSISLVCDWFVTGLTGLWVMWVIWMVRSFAANDFKNPLKIDFAEKMVIYFIIALTTMLWI